MVLPEKTRCRLPVDLNGLQNLNEFREHANSFFQISLEQLNSDVSRMCFIVVGRNVDISKRVNPSWARSESVYSFSCLLELKTLLIQRFTEKNNI